MKEFCMMKGMGFPALLWATADVPDYFRSSTRRNVLARGGRGRRKEKVQKPQRMKPVQNPIFVLIILEVCKAVETIKRRRKATAAGEGRNFQRQ
jgi:hypothetical protein